MTSSSSFDVFDTTITRVFARPADLFTVLGDAQVSPGGNSAPQRLDGSRFREQRIAAEQRARERAGPGDVSLNAVYRELASALGLDSKQTPDLMQQEVDLELQSARPVPPTLKAIGEARARGQRVIFISDMYLPSHVLRSMLEACGAYLPGDAMYVSNEVGLTKASGKLYRHVLEQEGISPGQLHHWGDNDLADIRRARALGIASTQVTRTRLNRYEEAVADAAEVEMPARSLVAGASRLARLDCPYEDEHLRTIWETGASVAGPILTGYVSWLLAHAWENGLRRLYFVARDGQILQRLAGIVTEKLGLPMECRYLLGSRQAWHLPAVTSLGEFEYSWILAPTHFLSVRSLLQRMEITPEEIRADLEIAGLPPGRWEANLGPWERESLFRLVRSGRLDPLILSRASEARQSTLAYFAQEGLTDPVALGLVDMGWHGRLQHSAGDVLALGGNGRPLTGYYFGLMSGHEPRPGDRLHPYCWSNCSPCKEFLPCVETRILMEAFTAADHGGVRGYHCRDGRAHAVLLNERNEPALQWGLEAQQEAILDFAARLDSGAMQSLAEEEWVGVWTGLLSAFYLNPTLAEAHAYGLFPDAEDQNAVMHYPLATPFTWADAAQVLRTGQPGRHHNEWSAASQALTPRPTLLAMGAARRAARLLGRPR